MAEREIDQNEERPEVKTFPVPFTLGKIKSPYELFLNYYQTQRVDFGSFF